MGVLGEFLLLMLLRLLAALAFRWRFQFSLRSLLLLPVGVAIPFSWLATQMRAAGEQREVVKDVVELGGCVIYDYQIGASNARSGPPARDGCGAC